MLTLSSKIFPSNLENFNFILVCYFLTAFFFSKQCPVAMTTDKAHGHP